MLPKDLKKATQSDSKSMKMPYRLRFLPFLHGISRFEASQSIAASPCMASCCELDLYHWSTYTNAPPDPFL